MTRRAAVKQTEEVESETEPAGESRQVWEAGQGAGESGQGAVDP